MARFVGLKTYANRVVLVNADNVTKIYRTDDGHTVIVHVDEGRMIVHGTPLEVATALGMGEPLMMLMMGKAGSNGIALEEKEEK